MEKLELKTIALLLSIAIIIIGGGGMLYCLPFLYSSKMEDLVGAGFPFLGGTILVSCGVVSLAIISTKNKNRL